MKKSEWIHCPICGNKTRDRIREDTILKKLPSLLSEMQAGKGGVSCSITSTISITMILLQWSIARHRRLGGLSFLPEKR